METLPAREARYRGPGRTPPAGSASSGSRRSGSSGSTRTRRRRSTACGRESTWSSSPAPPGGRPSATTSRCWRACSRRPRGARALPLPDQGAGAGPAQGAAPLLPRAPRTTRPRRVRRTKAAAGASRFLAGTYDGDTPADAATAAARRRRNILLTNPDMLHCGILPHHARWADVLRQLCATSWSTRSTSTAGSSAPTWPTCCAGCGGSAATTAPTRSGSAPPPPSPTRGAGRAADRAAQLPQRSIDDGSPRGTQALPLLEPAAARTRPGMERRSANVEAREILVAPAARRATRRSSSSRRAPMTEVLLRDCQERAARRRRRPGEEAALLPRPATFPRSGARSRRRSSRGSCSASSPRTRWSWESTSAPSTPPSSSAIPGRSPRPGSRRAARGGARRSRPRSSSATTPRSTST